MFAALWVLSIVASADAGVDAPDARPAVLHPSAAELRRQASAPWAAAQKIARGPAASIGTPNDGCVRGAAELPLGGRTLVVLHPERHRRFGHPTLVRYLTDLGTRARTAKLAPLAIGDLGQPRGGPTPSGHRSHQNGLDVDIGYGVPGPALLAAGSLGASVVGADRRTVMPAPRARVFALVRLAAQDPAVDRLFVHPAIKKAICQTADAQAPWMRRVRPWWGHDDHLHVRLRCPEGDTACVKQELLPEGAGCDASLDWWWSEDARKTASKRQEEATATFPPPPRPGCVEVLKSP